MIKTKMMRVASLFALCAVSVASHAALTTLTPADGWPPLGSTGLESVQFNAQTANGVGVATGAHAYKESPTLPNDGIDTFYANTGFSPNPPITAARWAFDYVINYGTATLSNYVTTFSFDIDPSAAINYRSVTFDSTSCLAVGICGLSVLSDSQNPVYVYGQLFALGSGFAFDPTANGDYAFEVSVANANGVVQAGTGINVVVGDIPEPGSLALVGLALGAVGLVRRRRA